MDMKEMNIHELVSLATTTEDPMTLGLLATNEAIAIKLRVADNPKTPRQALKLLATDEDEDVRANVAENLNTPLEILELLSKDKDLYVVAVLARNPNLPLELLENMEILGPLLCVDLSKYFNGKELDIYKSFQDSDTSMTWHTNFTGTFKELKALIHVLASSTK